jgi:hypothetical protein
LRYIPVNSLSHSKFGKFHCYFGKNPKFHQDFGKSTFVVFSAKAYFLVNGPGLSSENSIIISEKI